MSNVYLSESQDKDMDIMSMAEAINRYRAMSGVRINSEYIQVVKEEIRFLNKNQMKPVLPWEYAEAFRCYPADQFLKEVIHKYYEYIVLSEIGKGV